MSTSLAGGPIMAALDESRLDRAKRAFVTRRVDLLLAKQLLLPPQVPAPGDLVLARVQGLSPRNRIELTDGRRAHLFPRDEIILAYGNRYAPDQYEAWVPGDLGVCELVAAGGLAATVVHRHDAIAKPPAIEPLGLLANAAGERMNLSQFAVTDAAVSPANRPKLVAVAGTSMNAGKTTACTCLIRGLRDAGMSVNALKVTGTGAGGDLWQMKDAGAGVVCDFTDAGYASTYRVDRHQLLSCFLKLVAHASVSAPDVIVIEIADGLLQSETATLLRSSEFRAVVDVVLFAAGDALSAESGARWLLNEQLPIRVLSGLLSASPLASREAQHVTGLPVLTMAQMSSSETLLPVLFPSAAPGLSPPQTASDYAPAQRTFG